MGLSAVEMDAAARSDYEVAVETLAKPGRAPPSLIVLSARSRTPGDDIAAALVMRKQITNAVASEQIPH